MASLDLNSSSQGKPARELATRSLRSPAAAAPVFVLSLDVAGRITGFSAELPALLSCTADEILASPLTSFLIFGEGREELAGFDAILSTTLRDGQHVSCGRIGKSGKDVELSLVVLRDGSSASIGIIAVLKPLEAAKDTLIERKPLSQSNVEQQNAEAEDGPAQAISRNVDGSPFVIASPIMHRFMRMVERVASHTETVLINGETGTGKELIARTIHQSSNRRSRPWVDINCAALPENLVESELFGYEKGAFTGADASKPGLFEMADRGTLFLDEIGELQLHTQVKLLRVLDGYPFYRLGGNRKIKVDVRVIAATNQDLEAAVAAGRFRQDLFHRLGQFRLLVPPLRERVEDIVALAEHFLGLKNRDGFFTADAITALLSYTWPGNVRELRNLVARVAVQANVAEIQASQISAGMAGSPAAQRQIASIAVGNLDSMEEQMIIRALERTGGHRGQAADQLGISRRTLSRKLKEYNIEITPGESKETLGVISLDQQKFFRARIQLAVTLKNQRGDEANVQGVNLSTGGMGLDGLKEPMRFSGVLEVSFPLPDTESVFRAKGRIVWMGDEGRVGVRFTVIDPPLFEKLQQWTNKKMKDEGWDLPA
jgi:transcriptional regulator with PAS, ATPase and Fis domain